jgi:hypothetical protein
MILHVINTAVQLLQLLQTLQPTGRSNTTSSESQILLTKKLLNSRDTAIQRDTDIYHLPSKRSGITYISSHVHVSVQYGEEPNFDHVPTFVRLEISTRWLTSLGERTVQKTAGTQKPRCVGMHSEINRYEKIPSMLVFWVVTPCGFVSRY